jgi:hypothetical protein
MLELRVYASLLHPESESAGSIDPMGGTPALPFWTPALPDFLPHIFFCIKTPGRSLLPRLARFPESAKSKDVADLTSYGSANDL